MNRLFKNALAMVIGAAFAAGPALSADHGTGLVASSTIELADSPGKFDFLEVDSIHHWLLAGHKGDGTLDVFDLATDKLRARVKVGGAVHAAVDPKTKAIFVNVQDAKRVAVIDPVSLKEVDSIALGEALDAIFLEPKRHLIYSAQDDGPHVWVIDPKSKKIVGTVDGLGAPEIFTYDKKTDRVYLAIRDKETVVAINPADYTVTATWSTSPATKPHGQVLDERTGYLYVAGANGKLVTINTKTGAVVATTPIANGVDQIAADWSRSRIYCAGEGEMSVVEVAKDGAAKLVGNVQTAANAKNVAVDMATHKVWTTFTDGTKSYARSWTSH